MRNLFLTIALSVACAAAAAPPSYVEIGYELARDGAVLADVTQRLEHDGRTYRLIETWHGRGVYALRGDVIRTSEGAVAADGLRPRAFEDQRPGRGVQRAQFDPAATTPTLQQQDRLSFLWTLAFAPPRESAMVRVADGRHVASYTFQVSGIERIHTPAGEFEALKLVKRKNDSRDKTTEIWLAVDRQYIPVRILVVDKRGARLDQVAVRITAK